jgi:hypothetical protein
MVFFHVVLRASHPRLLRLSDDGYEVRLWHKHDNTEELELIRGLDEPCAASRTKLIQLGESSAESARSRSLDDTDSSIREPSRAACDCGIAVCVGANSADEKVEKGGEQEEALSDISALSASGERSARSDTDSQVRLGVIEWSARRAAQCSILA